MERSQPNAADLSAQPSPHRAAAEALAYAFLEDVDEAVDHRTAPAPWSDRIEATIVAAVQAERSRWLSRIEGLRSKAREAVQ
jgi:hypothetical protein